MSHHPALRARHWSVTHHDNNTMKLPEKMSGKKKRPCWEKIYTTLQVWRSEVPGGRHWGQELHLGSQIQEQGRSL